MVKISNIKSGFSLAEALISMLVLSIFFLATSKVMTHRQPDDVIWHEHGFCSCYVSGGQVKLDCSKNGSNVSTKNITGDTCRLKLPRNATVYNIAIISPTKVYEKDQFINESAFLNPKTGTVEVDDVDVTDDFTKNDTLIEQTFATYKELLKNFEPKATFIDSSSQAIFINW